MIQFNSIGRPAHNAAMIAWAFYDLQHINGEFYECWIRKGEIAKKLNKTIANLRERFDGLLDLEVIRSKDSGRLYTLNESWGKVTLSDFFVKTNFTKTCQAIDEITDQSVSAMSVVLNDISLKEYIEIIDSIRRK